MDEETQRLESASDWLICLQRDDLAVEEIVSWVQWCEADPRNRSAFERLLPLWQALDRSRYRPIGPTCLELMTPAALTQLREQLQSSSSDTAGYACARHRLCQAWCAVASLGPGRRGRRRAPDALGAWLRAPRCPAAAQLNHQTQLRGSREPRCDPAGRIQPGSRCAVGGRHRVSRGRTATVESQRRRGFFAVKHDETRPFVVRAGGLSVTAIGTQFDVLRTGSRTLLR